MFSCEAVDYRIDTIDSCLYSKIYCIAAIGPLHRLYSLIIGVVIVREYVIVVHMSVMSLVSLILTLHIIDTRSVHTE